MKVRWFVNDEGEGGEFRTRKKAMKEYHRLRAMPNYLYKTTLEVLRHDIKNDTYQVIAPVESE